MRMLEIKEKLQVLREEVELLKSRIQEHATGHIHTTIGVLEGRMKELEQDYLQEQRLRNK